MAKKAKTKVDDPKHAEQQAERAKAKKRKEAGVDLAGKKWSDLKTKADKDALLKAVGIALGIIEPDDD